MRLLTGLVASSLVTLAASKLNNIVAQLSPEETRLLLAERLGVSRFHELKLQGADVHKTYLDMSSFKEQEREAVGMFTESPRKGNFVLSLAGMKDNKLNPELPSIMIVDDSLSTYDDAPSASSVASLLSRLASEKAELSGLHKNVFSKTSAGGLCVSVPRLEELAKFEAVLDKNGFPTRLPEDLQHLVSTLNPTETSQSKFLTEFTMIRRFMEVVLPGLPEDAMAYCHAPALEAFIAAKGAKSPEAKVAEALYSYLLKHIPSSIKSTVLLLPQPREGSHAKREEEPLSMIQPSPSSSSSSGSDSAPAKAKKILASGPIARCHSSKNACESSTSECSGHGSCANAIQAGSNSCWSCVCKPTVIKTKNGVKTTTWAGAACQKKDISIPFNIFLVFGIVITFIAIATINLLYSIGDEPLPSVLSAGVAPAKHN